MSKPERQPASQTEQPPRAVSIAIPATRFSRYVHLSISLKGWSVIIQDDPKYPTGVAGPGFSFVLYGPLFGRYANGAKAMLYCWHDGTYRHREFGVAS